MSKKIAISLAAMLLLSSSAFAEDTNTLKAENSHANGYYMGLGYGTTSFSDGDFGKEFENFKVAPDQDSDSGFKLYGGYKFNKIVAVEGSYINYGTMNFKYTEDGTGTATQMKPYSLNVAANLGYDFLNNQLRPFALAGVGYVNYAQSGVQKVYTTDGSFATTVGLGVEYTPTLFQGVGFRLAYDADIAAVSVNYPTKDDKTFWQTLHMISLSAQYRF